MIRDHSNSLLESRPKIAVHEQLRCATGHCSLGVILTASSKLGICCILLGDDSGPLLAELQRRFPNAETVAGDWEDDKLVAKVVSFVDSPGTELDLPVDVRGTVFQKRVWQALREIPFGTTTSYKEIAARIGHPKSIRAVAGACAANPIALVIPCHRVVRSDGHLSGFRWGIERKRRLIQNEILSR